MPRSRFDRNPGRGSHSRRQFITRAGLVALGGPAFLAACTRGPDGSADVNAAEPLRLASPSNPVTWPINDGNEAIPDGRPPEANATLQIYNYVDYIDQGILDSFEAKYKCKVTLTTFGDLDEALTKIRQGTIPFDVWLGSGYDLTSRLVSTSLIRPLNHTYIPNIQNVWSSFTDPWYDKGWLYTVPFTVYTSGLGWRTDMIKIDPESRSNPWETLWDPRYKGSTAVWDDYRSTIEMALLKAGITNVNTDKAADLDTASEQLRALTRATAPKVTISMYQDMPAGLYGQATMWSGDAVNAAGEGTNSSLFRYWPGNAGKIMVDNDLLVVLKGGNNPVLAHLFLNHMLDAGVALKNFGASGYQPPQLSINPDTMVAQGLIPSNLASVIVREDDFKTGLPALELTTDNQAAWHSIWLAFKAGN